MKQTKQVEKIHDIFDQCIDEVFNRTDNRVDIRRRYAKKTLEVLSQAQKEVVERVKGLKKSNKIEDWTSYPPVVSLLASVDLKIRASKKFGYDQAIRDLLKALQKEQE